MDQVEFDAFFKEYSKNVDNADTVSSFWKLSDAIILEIITRSIGVECKEGSVICDAGGGTGRWVVKLSRMLMGQFLIYDRSQDMLNKARENISAAKISSRVELIQGDITDMSMIPDASINHIVSIYSPLSFIYQPQKAAAELFRVLRPGGKVLVMAHSHHNALASKINNYHASISELERLSTSSRVLWAPHVPELVTYSKESMEDLLISAGFEIEKTYGIPVFVQPGPEDFDPENKKTSAISRYLNDEHVFRSIFQLEMVHNSDPTVVNRGMNIFSVGTKRT